MVHHEFVEIDLPEAKTLSDLTGISFDLETAHGFAAKLREVIGASNPDFTLIDALTTTMLVRYSRAFTSGSRQNLKEEALLAAFDEEQRTSHRRFRDLRNKYVAHPDSPLEHSLPRAHFVRERVREEGFTSITCQHARLVGFSDEDAGALMELAESMINYVSTRIGEERQRVLASVRAMPIDTVLATRATK